MRVIYSHNLTIVMLAKDNSGAGGLVGVGNLRTADRAIKEERRVDKDKSITKAKL